MVVATSLWPSSSCTMRMSVPASSRCVAKECRSVCGVITYLVIVWPVEKS